MSVLRKRLKTKEFQTLFESGVFVHGRCISILVKKNLHGAPKFGVTIKKKKRNSVKRNFIRRRLREAFFGVQEMIPDSIDVVIIGNHLTEFDPLPKIGSELLYLINKAIKKGF
ncbi:MAG: ribonuclease P protein component [Caldisericia bacterium]|nr:ribonuclease P protein component [Caldisericia bacterium]